MNRVMALLLVASAALPLLANPVAATAADHKISVNVSYAVKDDKLLNGGRLPPEANVKYEIIADASFPSASACIEWATATFQAVPKEKYVTAIVAPQSTSQKVDFDTGEPYNPVGPQGGTARFLSTVTISTTRDAPALSEIILDFTVKVRAGDLEDQDTCNMSEGSGAAQLTLKADYLALMAYRPNAYILKAGQNSGVRFAIEMTNHGNGPTKVRIGVENPGKLESVVPPTEQHIELDQSGYIEIQARTPHQTGYQNTFYTIIANFDGVYDGNLVGGTPSRDAQAVTLSVQVQGVYAPGFDGFVALGALALGIGLVGLSRRRR